MNPQDALQIAPLMMQALLQMLSPGSGVKIVGGVQEDALMAIGTLVEGTLKNKNMNHQTCNTVTGLNAGEALMHPCGVIVLNLMVTMNSSVITL